MPHFYNHESSQFGKIKVIPMQWWRRKIKIGNYSIPPYATMSQIEFTILVEIPNPRPGINLLYFVYETFGNGAFRKLQQLEKKTLVSGKAEYTGDIKFVIAHEGIPPQLIGEEGVVLFDDNVLSLNGYIWGWGCGLVGIVLSGLCSLVVGLLLWSLGFIKIDPAWMLRIIK